MPGSQPDFPYDAPMLDALEAALSSERLNTYLEAAGYDRKRAILLYLWNVRISEAFFLPLQCAEVTFRNSVDRVLSQTYGQDWHSCAEFTSFLGSGITSLEKTKARIKLDKRQITTARIISSLPFDFWTALGIAQIG
jgi:hypothetical protein